MKRILTFLTISVLLSSCGEVIEEYSNEICHVLIWNDKHLNATLASATNSSTPGIFCFITQKSRVELEITTHTGSTDKITMFEAEARATTKVGRKGSIIIGYSNCNHGVFYGFDAECPNCYMKTAGGSRLRFDGISHVLCDICERRYDLNNRGLITQGDKGEPLTRYHASCSDPNGNGVIVVQ